MRLSLPIALLIIMLAMQAVSADEFFDNGVVLYKKGNYKGAINSFKQAISKNPFDSNALYYQALCYQYIGDNKNAVADYAQLVKSFPTSDAGRYAAQALAHLAPQYLHQLQKNGNPSSFEIPVSSSPSESNQYSDSDRMPNESRVYFQREGGLLHIDGFINNRPVKMIFDTGAEATVVGRNHLEELGIKAPTGRATGYVGGVGSGGLQQVWTIPVDIKVGQIERKNFPLMVQDNMPVEALLGQNFFRDFQYTIDSADNSIRFVKKSTLAGSYASDDRYAVPFVIEGREIVVQVEVNGHSIPMYFDSGASTIAFTRRQIEQCGIQVPEDAERSIQIGVAGQTTAHNLTVPRMKMGAVEKFNVPVSVVDSSNMAHPLLGQPMFYDYKFTVDYENHIIHFLRR